MEDFIHGLIVNNESLIGFSGIIVLALVAVLLFLTIRAKGSPASSEARVVSGQVTQLEETLKRVLEQTGEAGLASTPKSLEGLDVEKPDSFSEKTTVGNAVEAVPAAASDDPDNDPTTLRTVIEKQRLQLLEMKETLEKGTGESGAAQDLSVQLIKIKDLEARLSEYEIIEDDIADLSIYKEENVKLQDEIVKLKAQEGGGAEATPVSEGQAPVEGTAELAPEEPILDANNKPIEEPLEDMAEKSSENIMAEFAAAVGQEVEDGAKPEEKEDAGPTDFPEDILDGIEEQLAASSLTPPSKEGSLPESTTETGAQEEVSESKPEKEVAPAPEAAPKSNAAPQIDMAAMMAEVSEEAPKETVKEEPVAEAPKEEAAPEPTVEEEFITDDIMAEFSAAVVESQSSSSKPKEEAAVEASASSIEETAEEAPPAEDSPVETSEENKVTAETGGIDTDQMLAEMKNIPDEQVSVEEALGQEADIDKMAEEASQLGQAE